jgi:CRISPR/Cas system-associated exonuclease Cas4 (RecB family)
MKYNWSFSRFKQYVNCPKQYQEMNILKNYIQTETKQMKYGTEVHKALENYVKDGTVLPANYERFKKVVDELIAINGTKYTEYEMALCHDRKPTAFDSENRWVRGIVDLLIIDGDTAYVIDYKTGSNKYPDPKQLKLMALMTFAHFPEVQKVKGGLLFLMHNSFMPEEYSRDDIAKLWLAFTPTLARMSMSYELNKWVHNPTPLCGWCPVTTCTFYRER